MSYNFLDELRVVQRRLERSIPATVDAEWIGYAVNLAFREGYKAGVTAFAWWKDGEQQVGTTGTRLRDVLRDIKEMPI